MQSVNVEVKDEVMLLRLTKRQQNFLTRRAALALVSNPEIVRRLIDDAIANDALRRTRVTG